MRIRPWLSVGAVIGLAGGGGGTTVNRATGIEPSCPNS
jgi:hypothetical protein